MQHHRAIPSRSTLLPDVVRNLNGAPTAPTSSSPLPRPNSEFLIVGIFALRLAKRLIEGLERYPERDADITWLASLIAPYPLEFALAKISGAQKDIYVAVYRDIVSRMKRQPRYPIRFMQMNPDRSMLRQHGHDEAEGEPGRQMTDLERLDIIDFCDAAGEWGSTVPIPAREADRMIELANQRRVADLIDRRPGHSDRHVHFEVRAKRPVV